MIITAVANDPPRNSSIQFDIIFPLSFMQLSSEDQNWLNAYLGTFVILQPGSDLKRVTEKFDKVYAQYAKEQVAENKKAYGFDPQVSYGLQKMEDIHLNPLLKFTGNRESGIINESKPVYSYLFMGYRCFYTFNGGDKFYQYQYCRLFKRGKRSWG
jgi:putative ABC transport system permease protein